MSDQASKSELSVFAGSEDRRLRACKRGLSTLGPAWTLLGASALFTLLISGACSRTPASVGAAPQGESDSIYVYLDNNNFYDASVYVNFSGGSRRRLASLRAYSQEVATIRWDPGEFWFEVDFIGARFETRTRRMSVSPGESVELQLTANAHRTGQLIVRRR